VDCSSWNHAVCGVDPDEPDNQKTCAGCNPWVPGQLPCDNVAGALPQIKYFQGLLDKSCKVIKKGWEKYCKAAGDWVKVYTRWKDMNTDPNCDPCTKKDMDKLAAICNDFETRNSNCVPNCMKQLLAAGTDCQGGYNTCLKTSDQDQCTDSLRKCRSGCVDSCGKKNQSDLEAALKGSGTKTKCQSKADCPLW
jgi:hypothetical protein